MNKKPLKSPLREENERRSHPRKGSRILAHYETAGKRHAGYLIDIGPEGACLETARPHPSGETIHLCFKLSARSESSLKIGGKIVSAKQKAPRTWWLGVRFEALEPDVRRELSSYLGG